VNFRHPNAKTHLEDTFRALLRGDEVNLPREQRPRNDELSAKVPGGAHHRDACARFFPLGHGEDGCLRELPEHDLGSPIARHAWLNAAYRFGIWVGDVHEHYDVQRGTDRPPSPPEVYCAKRQLWATVTKAYVNVFSNDVVRDNDVFASNK
jgi:hypothetical protein